MPDIILVLVSNVPQFTLSLDISARLCDCRLSRH